MSFRARATDLQVADSDAVGGPRFPASGAGARTRGRSSSCLTQGKCVSHGVLSAAEPQVRVLDGAWCAQPRFHQTAAWAGRSAQGGGGAITGGESSRTSPDGHAHSFLDCVFHRGAPVPLSIPLTPHVSHTLALLSLKQESMVKGPWRECQILSSLTPCPHRPTSKVSRGDPWPDPLQCRRLPG